MGENGSFVEDNPVGTVVMGSAVQFHCCRVVQPEPSVVPALAAVQIKSLPGLVLHQKCLELTVFHLVLVFYHIQAASISQRALKRFLLLSGLTEWTNSPSCTIISCAKP